MKPDYRITIAIGSLLIVTSLFFPPWKHSFTGQFSGFHFLFSDAKIVNLLELDYARLGMIVLGITLLTVVVHLLLTLIRVKPFFDISQYLLKKVQPNVNKKIDLVSNNYIVIKSIIIFLLGVMVVILDK
ncbi:MAG: hypothetical protein E6Q62_09290 [Nitrosomonas sp.]|nr:MAG: hypothetical protein E6Q62_09290 [Nitrosomonas sp.]